jgi:hypothetical protein
MAYSEKVIKEFPEGEPGQRIGWTAVSEAENGWSIIDVATATLLGKGAAIGAILSDDSEIAPKGRSGGLTDISRFQVFAHPEDAVFAAHKSHLFDHVGPTTVNLLGQHLTDSDLGSAFTPIPALARGPQYKLQGSSEILEAKWADSAAELIGLIKQTLTEHDLMEKYPFLYYFVNSAVSGRHSDTRDLLLPDAAMHGTTLEQYEAAHGVESALAASSTNDKSMLRNLTVFGEIPADEIPDEFRQSRQRAHGYEQEVQDGVSRLEFPRSVYLPIGFRPEGRSWPYMDAGNEKDETTQGIIGDLKEKKIDWARTELQREVRELRERHEYAQEGAQRLEALSVAELQVPHD